MRHAWLGWTLLVGSTGLVACATETSPGPEADADADADGDGDGDGDADGDGDGDGDGDLDACAGGAAWAIRTLDAAAQTDTLAVATDASAGVHLVLEDRAIPALRHARWAGGRWELEVIRVPADCSIDWDAAITVGADGAVHVACASQTASVLHMTNRGGAWTLSTVPNEDPAMFTPALALDGRGSPQIEWLPLDLAWRTLRATATGGEWSVEEGLFVPSYDAVSLALSPSGEAHVTYLLDDHLEHHTFSTTDTLPDSEGADDYNQTFLHAAETHVFFGVTDAEEHRRLLHASAASGAWTAAVVGEADDLKGPSATVGASGRPRAAWLDDDPAERTLRIAARADDGSWSIESLTGLGARVEGSPYEIGYRRSSRTAIAEGSDGTLHVAVATPDIGLVVASTCPPAP